MPIDQFAVREVCRKTDRRLWNAYHYREIGSRPAKPFSRLVFPSYANGNIRVSEQEARFAFVESVLESDFFYSVETPTSRKFQFTGKKAVSAQTDFTLRDGMSARILNVEFKKGVSFETKSGNTLRKDVQKLLHESVPGMWFHLISSADNTTLKKVLDTLSSVFSGGLRAPELNLGGNSNTILFHVCVLKQCFSIHKEIVFSRSSDSHEAEFAFSYKVSRQRFKGSSNANGWDIHQNNCPQT